MCVTADSSAVIYQGVDDLQKRFEVVIKFSHANLPYCDIFSFKRSPTTQLIEFLFEYTPVHNGCPIDGFEKDTLQRFGIVYTIQQSQLLSYETFSGVVIDVNTTEELFVKLFVLCGLFAKVGFF